MFSRLCALVSSTRICGAVDNIDHNTSARTAHDSFHGTAISLIQFPTVEKRDSGAEVTRINPDVTKINKITRLSPSYTMTPPPPYS